MSAAARARIYVASARERRDEYYTMSVRLVMRGLRDIRLYAVNGTFLRALKDVITTQRVDMARQFQNITYYLRAV